MNVIDSLVIELGLDASKFTKDQKDALESLRKFEQQAISAGKNVEASQKKSAQFFSTMKSVVAGALGGFAGTAIVQMINNMQRADAQIGRTSITLNTNAETLKIWQIAARQAGGTAEDITSTFSALSQDVHRFLAGAGGGGFLDLFNALGIRIQRTNGQLKTMDELLLDVVQKLDERGLQGAQRAAFLSTLPGITQGSLNLMMKSRSEMEAYIASATRLNNLNRDSVTNADAYTAALVRLDTAWESLKRNALTPIIPALTEGIEALSEGVATNTRVGWMNMVGQSIKNTVYGWGLLLGIRDIKPPAPLTDPGASRGGGARPTIPTGSMTRADRNNNPGNIEYGDFARRHGATRSDGRFAVFPDRETGFKAAEALLGSANYRNLTLPQIGARWAEGDPNWARNASRATGVPMDRPLTDAERIRIARLGTVAAEGSRLGPGVAPGGGAAPSTTTTQTNIQTINVNVPAGTDGAGIAAGIGVAIRRNGLTGPTNMGQQ